MNSILVVALGGAIGSVARYLLSTWVMQRATDWRFPIGTFVVNLVGCLVIGVLAGLVLKCNHLTTETRLFLFTGIVGGFTTFSAFELETFTLLRNGEVLVAGSYILLSVALGLLALWLGFSLTGQKNI